MDKQEIQNNETEETFEELEARAKAFLERCTRIKKNLSVSVMNQYCIKPLDIKN